jgi:hypothetical protein
MLQAAPTERKRVTSRRATFSSFCQRQRQGQTKVKEKANAKESRARAKATAKARKARVRNLEASDGLTFDDTCHFCKQPRHFKAQCPKYAALSTKTSYGRIRAKLPNDKVYVYDLLEDSVDAGVCGNGLFCECDWMTCTPPVETLLFQEASRSFLEDGMWDMVSAAKTSNPPLSKEVFLQTQGQSQDCWEDDEDVEDDHEAEADNSSGEDN